MPYAITQCGWREIGEGWDLAEAETYADKLPEWLIELTEKQLLELTARSQLSTRLNDANQIIQPLQDDYDIDDISVDNLSRWKIWKRYRSTLGKTPEREGWPTTPDWPATPEA